MRNSSRRNFGFLATYTIDHTELCVLLEQRLNGRSEFHLQVLVDRENFLARTPVRQRPRLVALRNAGAEVYLCRGQPPLGAFHKKALIVDRRTAFQGSANFTQKSLQNEEQTLRMRGPPVDDVLVEVEEARGRGVLWHGS